MKLNSIVFAFLLFTQSASVALAASTSLEECKVGLESEDAKTLFKYAEFLVRKGVLKPEEFLKFSKDLKSKVIVNPVQINDAASYLHYEQFSQLLNSLGTCALDELKTSLERVEWKYKSIANKPATEPVKQAESRPDRYPLITNAGFVNITGFAHEFEIQTTPVTQKQYKSVVEKSFWDDGDNNAAYGMSIKEILQFCDKLNRDSDEYFYRLPTYDEWEFVANSQKGEEGYYFATTKNILDYAWVDENSRLSMPDVKQKRGIEVNGKYIFDLLGNVFEWLNANDMSSGYYYAGGSFKKVAGPRSFKPQKATAGEEDGVRDIGFRLVRVKIRDPQLWTLKSDEGLFLRILRMIRSQFSSYDELTKKQSPSFNLILTVLGLEESHIINEQHKIHFLCQLMEGKKPSFSNNPYLEHYLSPIYDLVIEDPNFNASHVQKYLGFSEDLDSLFLFKSFEALPFEVAFTPVTQQQWVAIMHNNPSYFRDYERHKYVTEDNKTIVFGKNFPVETISAKEIQEFLRRLNRLDMFHLYRLPTDAEWKKIAKELGYKGPGTDLGLFSKRRTASVEPFRYFDPLAHLFGNVWEIVSKGSVYAIMGGGFRNEGTGNVQDFGSHYEHSWDGTPDLDKGFRIIREKRPSCQPR